MMQKYIKLIIYIGIMHSNLNAISSEALIKIVTQQKNPFSYDLDIKIIPSKQSDAHVTVCCHGYGSNNTIVNAVHSWNVMSDHLIGFNFPDFNCVAKQQHVETTTFGSIQEILPLIYLLKVCVIDAQMPSIKLYGFSAGGGAIINVLAALNQSKYDEQLKKIGITHQEKKAIIVAIQKGVIILDCPLKSMEEIIALRGKTQELMIVAERYAQHDMRPIDAIKYLEGLNLTIFLHFQIPDAVIGNRDDTLFIERLSAANKGSTRVVLGNDGGHNTFHASLWKEYKKDKQI